MLNKLTLTKPTANW